MRRSRLAALGFVVCVAVAAPVVAGGPTPLVNDVLDLLDDPVLLDIEVEPNYWESRVFDTSAYSRIVLRVSGESEDGGIVCDVAWQYTPEDKVQAGSPTAGVAGSPAAPRRGLRFVAPFAFGPVGGLQARVICRASTLLDFGRIDPDPVPASGTLTDVKVLLREE
ncbi:MAG: hypothetical protein GY716_13530 [bacterium]|nr:hypothetical protein [bacterium]